MKLKFLYTQQNRSQRCCNYKGFCVLSFRYCAIINLTLAKKGIGLFMKRLIGILLTALIMLNLCSLSAFADSCCYLEINEITEADGKVILSMYYRADPGKAPRDIAVYASGVGIRETQYCTVDEIDSSFTVEFDAAKFISNQEYVFEPYFITRCEGGTCDWDYKRYTVKNGIELITDYDGSRLELIGNETIAVRLTVPASGFYNLSLSRTNEQDFRGNIEMSFTDYSTHIGTAYYEKDKEILCLLSEKSGSPAACTVDFESVTPTNTDCLISGTPKDGDKLYEIDAETELTKINIPVTGVYDFKLLTENDEVYSSVLVYKDGDIAAAFHESAQALLEAGEYQVYEQYLDSTSSIEIYYTVPDALETDKDYSVSEYANETFYILTLDKPSELNLSYTETEVSASRIISFEKDIRHSIYVGTNSNGLVWPASTYFITFYSAAEEESGTFRLSAEGVSSVNLGEVSDPVYTDSNGNKIFAFVAPEDGEYELDFSVGTALTTEKYLYLFDDLSVDCGYVTLKKGEWINARTATDGVKLKVTKVTSPVYTPLSLGTALEYTYISGKNMYYSFTASEADSYKLSIEGYKNYKIYNAESTIMQGKTAGYESINFDLEANETIYIEICGTDVPSILYTEEIKITSRSALIENNSSFDIISYQDNEVSFKVEEDGFYDLFFAFDISDSVQIFLNEKSVDYVFSSNNAKVSVYLKAGVKNLLNLYYPYTNNKVTLSWVKASLTEIEADKEINADNTASYVFAPTETGIYLVTDENGKYLEYPIADMAASDDSIPCYSSETGEQFFYAQKGSLYKISFSENTTTVITKANEKKITAGKIYTSGETLQAYSFNVAANGEYRCEGSFSNAKTCIWYNGEWLSLTGTDADLLSLAVGTHYIVSFASNDYINSSRADASFKIYKSARATDYYISVEDCFYTIGNYTTVRLIVKSPVDGYLEYGAEVTPLNGQMYQSYFGGKMLKGNDTIYYERDYQSDLELGCTYKLKPFMALYETDEDGNITETGEFIYGEEKTYTVALTENVTEITDNPQTAEFKMDDFDSFKYYYNKYFKFIQPTDYTETYTTITVPDFVTDFYVYDKSFKRVYPRVLNNIRNYALTAGELYYIVAECEAEGTGKILISSLPETLGIVSEDVNVSNQTVSFELTGEIPTEKTTVYGALFDENGKMLEMTSIEIDENSQKEQEFTLEKLGEAKRFKILYFGNSEDGTKINPLCDKSDMRIVSSN